MILFVSLLLVIFTRGLHQIIKYAYHQITNLCNRKTEAITAPIPKFVFVLLHIFEGTNIVCDIPQFLRSLLVQSVFTLIEIKGTGSIHQLVQSCRLWSQGYDLDEASTAG